MKLYTKKGDDGTTGLIGNVRVRKNDPRVTAYGEVDETNAAVGLAMAARDDDVINDALRQIQAELFTLGAELATAPGSDPKIVVNAKQIARLETWIDEAAGEVPPLKQFVLPGGTETAARLHLARTVCRRAERAVVILSDTQKVHSETVAYLNRLSDLLFALARLANHRAGVPDIPWKAPEEIRDET